MTLILNHDLDIMKAYSHTKSKVSRPSLSNVKELEKTNRQTHRRDRTYYHAAFAALVLMSMIDVFYFKPKQLVFKINSLFVEIVCI